MAAASPRSRTSQIRYSATSASSGDCGGFAAGVTRLPSGSSAAAPSPADPAPCGGQPPARPRGTPPSRPHRAAPPPAPHPPSTGRPAPIGQHVPDRLRRVAPACQPRPVALHLRAQLTGLPSRTRHRTRLPHGEHGAPSSRLSSAGKYAETPEQPSDKEADVITLIRTGSADPRHSRGIGIDQRRSPWSRQAGRYRAPRPGSFWGKLRIGAGGPAAGPPPAHLLGQQDPPHLAAPHGDAGVPGRLGQGIQGPLRRPGLIISGQLPGRIAGQLPWRRRAGQRDDPRPLRLGDPPLAPAPGRSPSPSRPAALNRCSQRRTVF